MHCHHELHLSQVFFRRLFLLRHEHCDSQSWVIMRLEPENGSSTILTLYPCAHLPTSFLPFLLLGWDAMTKATHRREFIGVYSSRVQSMRIMSGITAAGRHGADIVNWELIAWSTSRRPFRETPWECCGFLKPQSDIPPLTRPHLPIISKQFI